MSISKKLLSFIFLFTLIFTGALIFPSQARANIELKELQSQKERVEQLESSITTLLPLARAQGKIALAETLEDLLERVGDIKERIENKITKKEMFDCLAREGVVVYGTHWCPACVNLIEKWGGRETIDPIYVDCNLNFERCSREQKTNYVPEIQIKGEVYHGSRELDIILGKTGC